MSDYESNVAKKLEEKRKAIEAKKQARQQERNEEQTKRQSNPLFSMLKLRRLVISADVDYYFLAMHDYELGWDLLVHSSKLNEQGKKVYCHRLCEDPFEEGTCKICKDLDNGTVSGFEFEPMYLRGIVGYVFNTIGEKREFEVEVSGTKDKVVYFVNPAQVIEIQADGKGGSNILPLFKTLNKKKLFEGSIFSIRRDVGIPDARGIKRGGGYNQAPVLVEPEDLLDNLGRQGIEANLPEYAQKWSDRIKEMSAESKQKAKDEVFRFMLTSFENAEEIAAIKRIELPKKEQKTEAQKTEDEALFA